MFNLQGIDISEQRIQRYKRHYESRHSEYNRKYPAKSHFWWPSLIGPSKNAGPRQKTRAHHWHYSLLNTVFQISSDYESLVFVCHRLITLLLHHGPLYGN